MQKENNQYLRSENFDRRFLTIGENGEMKMGKVGKFSTRIGNNFHV
jgi:hypothetical protein